tara:strand:+ start:704 stop:2476 length:1773 start_codon:yes stop_codon:yes gene_type:complete
MKPIVNVSGVSKSYKVYDGPGDVFRELFGRKVDYDEFWALRDINFKLFEKQRLGVIGANGAGKSTLLKILTGHLQPTSGNVEINGRVSAMLSLNTVLNPEENGLANIKFNLLLNGAPRNEISDLVEDIIDFTELGPFIYAPVKTYSTGMNAKLAFGITTAIKPEILVIDEVLSVGDAYFMGKATERMIKLCNQGKALIFVSHANSSVQMLCDTVLWLDNGGTRMFGSCETVLKAYEEDFRQQEDLLTRTGNSRRSKERSYMAIPGELSSSNIYRLRLCSKENEGIFHDTFYIRNIKLIGKGVENNNISLAISENSGETKNPYLDVINSEWGRFYIKKGSECRILSARSGRNKGGQILIPLPRGLVGSEWELKICFEYTSILNKDNLKIELLDFKKGEWIDAKLESDKLIEDSWRYAEFNALIPLVEEEEYQKVLEHVENNEKPYLEISNVSLKIEGDNSLVLTERQPFSIEIGITVNKKIEEADVGIKIIRSDGTYIFWQSSGLVEKKITNISDNTNVRFHFDPNHFSAGNYQVSVYIANEWKFPENYPYSEVYDRKVGALNFTVINEFPGVDFGIVNQRVLVDVEGKKK